MTRHPNVDSYIASFPSATQKKLQQLRRIVRKHAPLAVECISYNMPAYKMGKPLVYFAGYAHHVGLYPTGKGIEAIKDELGDYKWSKGAVQFPLDAPLPVALIIRIIRLRCDHLS